MQAWTAWESENQARHFSMNSAGWKNFLSFFFSNFFFRIFENFSGTMNKIFQIQKKDFFLNFLIFKFFSKFSQKKWKNFLLKNWRFSCRDHNSKKIQFRDETQKTWKFKIKKILVKSKIFCSCPSNTKQIKKKRFPSRLRPFFRLSNYS